jgi:ATP-binding cassette, subfamily B, bacterial PglK
MKVLFAIWRLLDRRQQRRLAAMQVLSVLMALSTVGGMAAVLPFFTVLAEPNAISLHPALRFFYDTFRFGNENRFVIALGIVFAAAILLSNAINLLGSLAIDRFAFKVGEAFHTNLFDEYLNRGYEFHSRSNSSTLTSSVLYEVARVAGGILRHGLILVSSLVTLIFIVGSIILLNPLVALLAILGLGASYGAVYAVVRAKLRRNGEIESEDYAERSRIVGEGFGAIKELIVLQAQPLFVARLARCCRSISSTIVNNLAIAQSPRYILECATACVLAAVALRAHLRGQSVGPLIAQLSFIGLAVYRLLPVLQQVFLATVKIRADEPAFERIADDLRAAQARRPVAAPSPDESWAGRPRRDIYLTGVSFSHSSGDRPAVANVSLRIPAGAMVGFVGANGSGKTTLVDLLTGLLVPQSGRIEIDGILLDGTSRGAWQSTIAYVPQAVFVCDSTIAENIALGATGSQIDRGRVHAAARLAELEECVAALPQGYDTKLGERGARLSHGQRQRLGIARALYRDASVIVMDEATSAIDSVAERDITDMLAAQRGGRTILLVAHRLNALRHCDVIYELANGGIVRAGTFQELLAHAGAADDRPRVCPANDTPTAAVS